MAAGRGAGRASTIHVAVCGLTSASFGGLTGQGAGKSCLCNRFVRPKMDDFRDIHPSLLNHSDFGSNVINYTHFLYWGEKVVGLEDGQDVRFQIVEHTEFMDDLAMKPFSFTKPYHKRCTQLKLQSGGKVMYIEPDQLALPEQYSNVDKFPDKFVVEGFIICADVSTEFSDLTKDFFEKVLQNLLVSKKPVVCALTKFDIAKESSVAVVGEILAHTKKHIPVVEVSAEKGVNVDLCFLVLAHLVDSRKPKTRILTYADSKSTLDERVRRNEEHFQSVLDEKVTDFSVGLSGATNLVSNEVEFQLLRELCGSTRVNRLIRAKLNFLKKVQVDKRMSQFLEQLPASLDVLLPELALVADVESCTAMVQAHPQFPEHFVPQRDWRDDQEFLKSEGGKVPFTLLGESEGQEVLQRHIDKVLADARVEAACQRLNEALWNATRLIPGTEMEEVFQELGMSQVMSQVPAKRLMQLFQERMTLVEHQCVLELQEMLLERSDLFEKLEGVELFQRLDKEFQSDERYCRLARRPDLRKSAVIKHIANCQWPDKGPFGNSHLLPSIMEGVPEKSTLHPPSDSPSPGSLQWCLDPDDQAFNLAILARTKDNALTLRSDFMNHLSGRGTCEVNGHRYQLELKVFHGYEISSLTSIVFTPQGAVAVATSMECLDWLEGVLSQWWIPGDGDSPPPYRGMPLIILALDEALQDEAASPADSRLHQRAKVLANRVQCVLLAECPTTVPKRLVVSTVIHQLLSSLMDAVTQCHEFLTSTLTLQQEGLNVAVCSVVGDPYLPSQLTGLWLRHQLVAFREKDSALFLRSAIEKQHRTCTLTFHSALNASSITSSIHLGLILVYSAERPASLSILRFLLPKLPKIPMLVVAMVTEGSHDNQLLEAGHDLAEKWGALFLASNEESWGSTFTLANENIATSYALRVGCTSELFSKCWFSRFSSWNTQEVPEEVMKKIARRRPHPLPDRPLPVTPLGLSNHRPPSPTRHSIAVDLDVEQSVSEHTSHVLSSSLPPSHIATLPRSPMRTKFQPFSPQSSDPTYSNPLELSIGVKQKKATLERERKHGGSGKRTSFDLVIPAGDQVEESEYAVVADHLKFGKGSLNFKWPLKSPSMSPPPVPFSPPSVNGVDGEGGEEAYATVQTPPSRRRLQETKSNSYDHLEGKRRRSSHKYDHLAATEELYSTVNKQRQPQAQPVEEMYSTVNKQRQPQAQPVEEMYSTVNKQRQPQAQPVEEVQVGNQMYSVVQKKTRPHPPRRGCSAENMLVRPPLAEPRTVEVPDGMYSVVIKPGSRVPKDVKRKRTPPPLAPKPRINRTRQSPSPRGSDSPPRCSSADGGVSPREIRRRRDDLQPSPQAMRKELQKARTLSDKRKDTAQIGDLATEVAVRASSLPRDTVLMRDRSWSGGNMVEGSPREEEVPALPERHYSPTELGLEDEPPPLPPRNYSWSDVEDNDDEVLQSDDDLDDPLATITLSDHQEIYASIHRLSSISGLGGIEAIYNVVNQAAVEQASQPPPSPYTQQAYMESESSVYDTLESVLHSSVPHSPSPSPAPEAKGIPLVAPTPGFPATLFTPKQLKLINQQQKLMEKLQKKTQKESERRRRQESKKGGKRKTKRGKKEERQRYFGSPLEAVAGEGGVPILIKKCVEFIEKKGLKMEGIYRVPGKKEDCLALQGKFDEDSNVDLIGLGYCEATISSTMKAFFKLLPDPLISDGIAAKVLLINTLDVGSQRTKLHEILAKMPQANLRTLAFLMQHLHLIQEHQDDNKMSASNLAIVFWPTLMRPPLTDLADPSKRLGWQLAMTQLIEHPDFVPHVD